MSIQAELSPTEHAQIVLKNDVPGVLCHDHHELDLEIAVEGWARAGQDLDALLTEDVTSADVKTFPGDRGRVVELVRWARTDNNITYVSRQATIDSSHPESKMVRRGRKLDDIARVAVAATGSLTVGLAKWDPTQIGEGTVSDAVLRGVTDRTIAHPALRDLVTLGVGEPPIGYVSLEHIGEGAEEDPQFPRLMIMPLGVSSVASRYIVNAPPLDAVDMTPYAQRAVRSDYMDDRPLSEEERACIYEGVVHERLAALHALTGVLAFAAYELRAGTRMRP